MAPNDRDDLLRRARGFMESRILLSLADLKIVDALAAGPATAAGIAQLLGLSERGTTILLDAAVALAVLAKSGDSYSAPPETQAALGSDSESSMLPMLLHMSNMWRRWDRLSDVVRTGKPAGDGGGVPMDMEAFIGAMHVIARRAAEEFAAIVCPITEERLIDVGGASGTYAAALLRACPHLTATIFDQHVVVPMARRKMAEAGLGDRVVVVGGDFLTDSLPGGHDLALVSAIIHSLSFDENVRLFTNVRAAMASGGRVLVRDHVMAPGKTAPASGAIFAVNMLVGTHGGTCYSLDEITDMLTRAGYADAQLIYDDQQMTGVVQAVAV
ncbi:MAG: methyltransferase [Armatimonadetes bacterium]|nr:methyltransferase [Armatimonadota bacterium]